MANYFARKAGNINATDVWATTPSGTASDVWGTFTSADVLHSNTFAITVNVNTTVGEVRNDNANSAAAGGSFTISNGVTLTSNVYSGSAACVLYSGASGNSAFIVGNVFGGTANNAFGANNSSTGTLTITGNLTAGSGSNSHGAQNSSNGTLNITGNAVGGSATGAQGANNQSAGVLNVTGNVTGGSVSQTFGSNNANIGTLSIVGIATAGSAASGVNNASTGTINLTRAKGNAYGPGNTSGLAAAVGAANVGLGVIEIEELEYGEYGMSPTSGTGIRLKKLGSNVAVFNYVDSGSAKTLVDATQGQMPAATDVRSGVVYASGALTGTCAVPAAGSVSLGVPIDAGFGTAVLTPAAIRSELSVELGRIDAAISSRLAPNGTLATVTTLTNAPTSVTPSDIWSHATRTITGGTIDTLTNSPDVPTEAEIAAQVRTELSVELAKVQALNTERLANVATTAIVGNLIAQANS